MVDNFLLFFHDLGINARLTSIKHIDRGSGRKKGLSQYLWVVYYTPSIKFSSFSGGFQDFWRSVIFLGIAFQRSLMLSSLISFT